MKLIVDDDIEACNRLKEMLISCGEAASELQTETSPKKAKELILTGSYELVFLDIHMPSLNGIELIQALRKRGYSGSIVFTTADGNRAIEAMRAEALDYLLKPVIREELQAALGRFAAKSRLRTKDLKKLKNYHLTRRELEVARLLIDGKTSIEIADFLFLSKHTVDTHRRAILRKTKCKHTTELFRLI